VRSRQNSPTSDSEHGSQDSLIFFDISNKKESFCVSSEPLNQTYHLEQSIPMYKEQSNTVHSNIHNSPSDECELHDDSNY